MTTTRSVSPRPDLAGWRPAAGKASATKATGMAAGMVTATAVSAIGGGGGGDRGSVAAPDPHLLDRRWRRGALGRCGRMAQPWVMVASGGMRGVAGDLWRAASGSTERTTRGVCVEAQLVTPEADKARPVTAAVRGGEAEVPVRHDKACRCGDSGEALVEASSMIRDRW